MANNSRKIITPMFRLAFPHIWEPQEQNGKMVYRATGIFHPEDDLTEMRTIVTEAAKAKWGEKGAKGYVTPFRKGVDKTTDPVNGFDLDAYPFYAGQIVVMFKSYDRPVGVCKPTGDKNNPTVKISKENGGELYAGCYCQASIAAWCFEYAGKKGVSLNLYNIMKVQEGEPLSTGYSTPEGDFAEVAVNYKVDNTAMFAAEKDLLGSL